MVTKLKEVDKSQLTHTYIDPETVIKMAEANEHTELIQYLVPLLKWIYRDQDWFVLSDIKVLRRSLNIHQDIAPDIAIVKNVSKPVAPVGKRFQSWRVGQPNRPVPAVVFEIASHKTWRNDVGYPGSKSNKVLEYGILGVREYFAYDPYTPPLWAKDGVRLWGWKYMDGERQKLEPNDQGWLYSQELEAWLVPNGNFLQLYDRSGQRYLTEAEYIQREAERKLEATRSEAERKLEATRSEAERKLADEQATAAKKIAELEARLRQLENKTP